jgi:hypothetical protein
MKVDGFAVSGHKISDVIQGSPFKLLMAINGPRYRKCF